MKKLLAISLIIILSNSSFAGVILDTLYTNQINNFIKIDWQTSSEIDNDYFILERSIDSINYVPLSNISGGGNSFSIISYSYTDSTTIYGQTYYYRLKSIDFFGGYEYFYLHSAVTPSSIITGISILNEPSIQIYPNPTKDNISIMFSTPLDDKTYIKVTDIKGRIIYQRKVTKIESEYSLSQQIQGIYFVEIISSQKRKKQFKIIKR